MIKRLVIFSINSASLPPWARTIRLPSQILLLCVEPMFLPQGCIFPMKYTPLFLSTHQSTFQNANVSISTRSSIQIIAQIVDVWMFPKMGQFGSYLCAASTSYFLVWFFLILSVQCHPHRIPKYMIRLFMLYFSTSSKSCNIDRHAFKTSACKPYTPKGIYFYIRLGDHDCFAYLYNELGIKWFIKLIL